MKDGITAASELDSMTVRAVKCPVVPPGVRPPTARICAMMIDGQWHTTATIELAASKDGQIRAKDGLRRMRDLRKVGYTIEKRRMSGYKEYDYRLVV
jgi:hypothetical protein